MDIEQRLTDDLAPSLSLERVKQFYAETGIKPTQLQFIGTDLSGKPRACLLGILDVQCRGLSVVRGEVQDINLYVPRVAVEYQLPMAFTVGLMRGWDRWDRADTLAQALIPAERVDPVFVLGFTRGWQLADAILGGA